LLKSHQPDADFEHRLVSADGEFEFYFRCSESAARELVEHLDSLHERIAAALNAQAGVVEALEECMGFMVWETKECNGKKCRDPECISCNGDEYAQGYVQRSKDAHAKARAALAAIKGEKP
jgi:uncharacterized Zn finger protein